MTVTTLPDRIITDARIYTGDANAPWAEALAITDGRVSLIGSSADVLAAADTSTEIVRMDGRFVMPGLIDAHVHMVLGGAMIAWELLISPLDTKDQILERVRERAATLGPDEWIIGGVIGGTVLDEFSTDVSALAELDDAAGGRAVILRDATMHNRWVSSACLSAMGVGADTPDPEGGTFVRDGQGRLTGWLFEHVASALAEEAFVNVTADIDERRKVSVKTAISAFNSVGITTVQDAGSMDFLFRALDSIHHDGDLSLRVVTSTPVLPFIEPGMTGDELIDIARGYRSDRVRPDFVKFFLDGVPMTRTTAMLAPYICHNHNEDPTHCGEILWELDELVDALREISQRGLNAKIHAIGDAAARRALDAVERLRAEGVTETFHIAHAGLISGVDIPRFGELDVVAEISPHAWYWNEFAEPVRQQIPAETLDRWYPNRSLLEAGALVAAGSDWPVGAPTPFPWLGLETLVTRRNPNPAIEHLLGPEETLTLEQAIEAFTAAPARALGLGDHSGRLKPGYTADFIVLDRNLFEVPVTDIKETTVLSTWFEGEKIYENASARTA